jgi:hypothetical protein
MKVDLQAFEIWESLNARMALELRTPADTTVRCYAGLGAAVFEIAQGAAQFYSHKRSIAMISGATPHFRSVLPYLFKEGYEVQVAPETGANKEWIDGLKKDTCFALIAEDHAVTGELFELTEIEQALNEKKIFCLKVSHHNHLYREQTLLPYSVRICSYDPQTAVALLGARMKAPAMVASYLDWDAEKFLKSVQDRKSASRENQELIETFEKSLPKGFSALLQTSKRTFDRALIYTEEAGGETLQQFLSSALKMPLQKPGWETRLETTHLCRWGGIRNYDDWWKARPTESILRGLLILGTEVLEHPDMRLSLEKALRECQIAELT